MTSEQKIIRNKVGLLKLAQTLGSVSEACLSPAAIACEDPRPIRTTTRYAGIFSCTHACTHQPMTP